MIGNPASSGEGTADCPLPTLLMAGIWVCIYMNQQINPLQTQKQKQKQKLFIAN
jgi:hypothetical protein